MKFDFGEVISKAWKITWKHKVLWLFGLLASCGQGGSSNSNSFRNTMDSEQSPFTPEMQRQLVNAVEQVSNWFAENRWIVFVLIAVFLLLLALQIFMNIVGATGLIRGAFHIDGGAETLQFGGLFRESLGYFWRVFGLGFVIWVPFYIIFFGTLVGMVFVAAGGPTGYDASGLGLILILVGLCCCFLPFIFVLNLYYSQALRALLLENLGVFASITRGWNVFVANLGPLFVMWLIMLIIGIVIGVILAIPVYALIFPLLFDLMEGNIQSWQPFINTFILLILYSPIQWFLRSILMTFSESVWTLTYMRLTVKPEQPVVIPAPTEANV